MSSTSYCHFFSVILSFNFIKCYIRENILHCSHEMYNQIIDIRWAICWFEPAWNQQMTIGKELRNKPKQTKCNDCVLLHFKMKIICDTFCNLHVVFVGHSAVPYLTIAPTTTSAAANWTWNVWTKSVVCARAKGMKKHNLAHGKLCGVSSNAMVRSLFFLHSHSFCCVRAIYVIRHFITGHLWFCRSFFYSATYVGSIYSELRFKTTSRAQQLLSCVFAVGFVCFISFWSLNT